MKIEININEIVQKIDINKLIEEKIISDISEAIDIENIVDVALDNKEVKSHMNKKVINIIDDYISSEEGRNRIIDVFNDSIANVDMADILADDRVIELLTEFLKKNLRI